MTSTPMVVYSASLDAWFAEAERVPGATGARVPPCTSWERDLDHAARMSPERAALVLAMFPGDAVGMTLEEAWSRTEPRGAP